jgi:hypothetical protein
MKVIATKSKSHEDYTASVIAISCQLSPFF